jgi:hypothetical protein
VPEYDAFGREIGEDPLAALRQPAAKPEPVEAAAPEPVVAPDPRDAPRPEAVAAPAPAAPERPRFVPPPPRRRPRGLARLVFVLAVLGVAGLVAVSVGERVQTEIDSIVDTPKAEPPAPGVSGGSLIRQANFAKAIAALRRADRGRPLTLRVAPDRIDATLIAKSGRLHQVQVTPGVRLRELGSADGPTGAQRISYAAIDPAAPERLVRAGATRKQPARSIGYLVLSPGSPVRWAAYYKGGRIVLGDAHGRKTRVL